jgi:hypothetical protein
MGAMLRYLAWCMLALAAPAVAQLNPGQAVPAVNPAAAREIFERDWVLMNWALKFYDADRDILLSPAEAHVAAAAFRSMADANGDGRVTTEEYRAARQFILARY